MKTYIQLDMPNTTKFVMAWETVASIEVQEASKLATVTFQSGVAKILHFNSAADAKTFRTEYLAYLDWVASLPPIVLPPVTKAAAVSNSPDFHA